MDADVLTRTDARCGKSSGDGINITMKPLVRDEDVSRPEGGSASKNSSAIV
jgi:hypothetical protein